MLTKQALYVEGAGKEREIKILLTPPPPLTPNLQLMKFCLKYQFGLLKKKNYLYNSMLITYVVFYINMFLKIAQQYYTFYFYFISTKVAEIKIFFFAKSWGVLKLQRIPPFQNGIINVSDLRKIIHLPHKIQSKQSWEFK